MKICGTGSRLKISSQSILFFLCWLVAATGFYVEFEPAPVDLVMLVFAFSSLLLLAKVVFARLGWMVWVLGVYLVFELIALSNAVLAPENARFFLVVTAYLWFFFLALSALFVAHGESAFKVFMSGWVAAALVSASFAVAGFFDFIPREWVLRTEEGVRVKAFFKDPNVFGPHLVPPLLYLLLFKRNVGGFWSIIFIWSCSALLGFSVLLSGSRAAVVNLFVAGASYAGLNFYSSTKRGRLPKLSIKNLLVISVVGVCVVIIVGASGLNEQMAERASMQSYDATRFKNMVAAVQGIIENPLGIGQAQYKLTSYAGIHSLYLSLGAESGLGVLACFLVISGYCLLRSMQLSGSPNKEQSRVAMFSCAIIIGVLVNSLVLNTIHWRHLFMTLATAFVARDALGNGMVVKKVSGQ